MLYSKIIFLLSKSFLKTWLLFYSPLGGSTTTRDLRTPALFYWTNRFGLFCSPETRARARTVLLKGESNTEVANSKL